MARTRLLVILETKEGGKGSHVGARGVNETCGRLPAGRPRGRVPVAGWASTVLEVALAVGLLVGVRLRAVAVATGVLLLVFAVTMTVALGPEAPLSYSVWPAAAGAFLLASLRPAQGDVGAGASCPSGSPVSTAAPHSK